MSIGLVIPPGEDGVAAWAERAVLAGPASLAVGLTRACAGRPGLVALGGGRQLVCLQAVEVG